MDDAPLLADIAEGPAGGRAWWLRTGDGLRIRVGLWPCQPAKGTVLLLPGRTEYVEKYGTAARDLATHGLATFVVDWRGQGLSDRLHDDAMSGHVMEFTDYQIDLSAMLEAAAELDLPRPWHMLAHSMGGCIGLRGAMQGLDVATCVFSGPMWGIRMAEVLKPVAWSISWGGKQMGLGHFYAPGTTSGSYVLTEPFETNKLTRDHEMYQFMVDQLTAHPELGLGGPSLRWLHEALRETWQLSRMPSPDLPCLTVMGSDEDIVDVARIEARMRDWHGSQLHVIPNGRHEVLMEDAETRGRIFATIGSFMRSAAGGEIRDRA